jgi:hypothetical protein
MSPPLIEIVDFSKLFLKRPFENRKEKRQTLFIENVEAKRPTKNYKKRERISSKMASLLVESKLILLFSENSIQ